MKKVCIIRSWGAVPGDSLVWLHSDSHSHASTPTLTGYNFDSKYGFGSLAYGHLSYLIPSSLVSELPVYKLRTTTMASTSTHESRTSMDSGSALSPIISPSASYIDLSAYNPPAPRGSRQRPRRESAASSIFSLTSSLGTVMDWKSPKEYGTSGAALSS